ncbi:MAG: 2-oxo acid dehydrogenase subunit E2 [Bacteroidales bacterium]|nr:2-oxo acid dehydrogenase subunit E2 [Bacteroidales bacterium]
MNTTERKRNRRDRWDRIFVKDSDPFHFIMPFVMPTRCANEAVMSETFDITGLDRYLQNKNAQNPDFKYTWFHVICAAMAKVMVLRPKLNYFISGYRLYERRDIEIAFVIKHHFADEAGESLVKFVVDKDGGSLVEQVHSFTGKMVNKVRKNDEVTGISRAFNLFDAVPRPLMKLVVGILRRLEYHGYYPKALTKDDPCYSSLFITNLGSIKMSADYHHIFEWGTNSFFAVVNEKKKEPFFKEDGSYEMRDTIKMSFTVDERVADGFYFAKSIKLLKHIILHPEILDADASAPVDFEY